MDGFKEEFEKAFLTTYNIVNLQKFNWKHADRKVTTIIGG